MSNLKNIGIKNVYRSGDDDLLKDFYIPALNEAKFYDRAVGYFSTSLLAYAMKGVSSIIKNNGKIRLIVGYPLTEDEFEALEEGKNLQLISSQLDNELDRLINMSVSKLEKARLQLFMLLIATNRLQLKFAFKVNGMYHEKIGIIKDSIGNKILFHGSANETTNAIHPDLNFESIAVYKSWDSEVYENYAVSFEVGFEDLWSGIDKNIFILDMPSSMYKKISDEYFKKYSLIESESCDEIALQIEFLKTKNEHYPIVPKKIKGNDFKIYEHQKTALKNWFLNDKRGLFKLATGSGKTITALYGVSQMFENATRPRKMLLIVSVPYITLAEQWVEELSLFNMKAIKCFYSIKNWEEKLNSSISLLQSGKIEFVSLVVVNRTLTSSNFKSMISRVNTENIFFIGDECHHHGNENILEFLPDAAFKMGLSATPFLEKNESDFNEQNFEKEILENYYGNVIADYTLADALAEGILTPYKYHIVTVNLTVEESEDYVKLSKEIGRLMAIDDSVNNVALSNTVRKRNKIIANSAMKLTALSDLLKKHKFVNKSHTLFYVGEGSSTVSDSSLAEETSQLEAVAKIIRENDWKISKFTSLESAKARISIMDNFLDESIDALVSMRVLDEGIDIPMCKRAFILASSRNARQFIQRRGRILRRYKNKDYAEIYDFVVLPSIDVSQCNYFNTLVKRELSRVMDFVRLSQNRLICENEANDIANMFGIELMEV